MKLKEILIPNREGLDKNWWHRLAQVLIYGSTIIVLVFSFHSFAEDYRNWDRVNQNYLYSFEPEYGDLFGLYQECDFFPENEEGSISIICGNVGVAQANGIYPHFVDFLERFAESEPNEESFLIKTKITNPNYLNSEDSFWKFFSYESSKTTVNYQLLNQKIKEGYFDNVSAKRIVDFDSLIKSAAIAIILPVLWWIFLESIIYRAILYVAFGKKK